jgi:hypothetical protein
MQKTKVIIATLTGLIPLSFILTSLVFIYRYMWFSTETVPNGRMCIAIVGSIVTGATWGLIVSEKEPYKRRYY